MKYIKIHYVLILLIFCGRLAAENITTRSGITYKDVEVRGALPEGLRIFHSSGIVTIELKDLPSYLKRQYYSENKKVTVVTSNKSAEKSVPISAERVDSRKPTIVQASLDRNSFIATERTFDSQKFYITLAVVIAIILALRSLSGSDYTKDSPNPQSGTDSKENIPPNNSEKTENGNAKQSNSKTSRQQKNDLNVPLVKNEAYYAKVLGLTGKLTKNDIKKRYRELVSKYHPDKVEHLGLEFQEMASEKAKLINEAYDYFRLRYQI